MVTETINERERTSEAVLRAIRNLEQGSSYAINLEEALKSEDIDPVQAISTVWRLIDENRLFLDDKGALRLEAPERK
jgi:hypothetical protein